MTAPGCKTRSAVPSSARGNAAREAPNPAESPGSLRAGVDRGLRPEGGRPLTMLIPLPQQENGKLFSKEGSKERSALGLLPSWLPHLILGWPSDAKATSCFKVLGVHRRTSHLSKSSFSSLKSNFITREFEDTQVNGFLFCPGKPSQTSHKGARNLVPTHSQSLALILNGRLKS